MSRVGQIPTWARTRGRKPSASQKLWAGGVVVDEFPPSRFDSLVEELGIADRPDCWSHHPRVQRFVRSHYKRQYVPEWLLRLWGLDGEANLCA